VILGELLALALVVLVAWAGFSRDEGPLGLRRAIRDLVWPERHDRE
jgi:hypothetical protein